jgi:hypothetical protein
MKRQLWGSMRRRQAQGVERKAGPLCFDANTDRSKDGRRRSSMHEPQPRKGQPFTALRLAPSLGQGIPKLGLCSKGRVATWVEMGVHPGSVCHVSTDVKQKVCMVARLRGHAGPSSAVKR